MSDPAWKSFGINGMSKGARLFLSTGVAAELLRESGRHEDAAALEAEAKPGDIACIKDGELTVERCAVYIPEDA